MAFKLATTIPEEEYKKTSAFRSVQNAQNTFNSRVESFGSEQRFKSEAPTLYGNLKKTIKYYSPGGPGYSDELRDYNLRQAAPVAEKLGITAQQLVTNPQLASDPAALAKFTSVDPEEAARRQAGGEPLPAHGFEEDAELNKIEQGVADAQAETDRIQKGIDELGKANEGNIDMQRFSQILSNPDEEERTKLLAEEFPDLTNREGEKVFGPNGEVLDPEALGITTTEPPAEKKVGDTETFFTPTADEPSPPSDIITPPNDTTEPDPITIEPTPGASSEISDALLAELISQNPFIQEQLKDPKLKALFDSLPPELKPVYYQLLNQLGKSIEAGKVVNPDIEITPQKLQEFMDQATTELSPFYQERIRFIKKDLQTSLGRIQEDFQRAVSRAQEPFKQGLAAQAESEAQAGTTFGSERVKRERRIVLNQQQAIDDALRGSLRQTQDFATGVERRIGSEALGGLTAPSLTGANVSTGGFTPGERSLTFSPEGNILGTLPKQQTVDISRRASELEEIERRQRILDLSKL